MQKILLTTTALVAAVMISGGAKAAPAAGTQSTRYLQQNDLMGQSVLKATVDGYANWYMAYADNEQNEGKNEFDILGDAEIHFNVEATLRNGLKVGATSQLETDTTSEAGNIENTYMYIESMYGKVMVGRHDNVSEQLTVHSIDVGALGIQDSDFFNIVTGPTVHSRLMQPVTPIITTYFSYDEPMTKISYITPNFHGFQAGVTYAPFGTQTKNSTAIEDNYAEIGMITAVYESKFDQIGYAVSAGYGYANAYNSRESNFTQFNLGGRISYNNFSIAGSYRSLESKHTSTDVSVFDVGVSYETGPYALSVAYLSSEYNNDHSIITGLADTENSILLVSGKYNMAAGVDSFITLGYGNNDYIVHDYTGISGSYKNDGWAIVGGMMLSF